MASFEAESPNPASCQHHQLGVLRVVGESFPGRQLSVANGDNPLVWNNADERARVSAHQATTMGTNH